MSPSPHILSEAWRDTFPFQDIGGVLQFMQVRWIELNQIHPKAVLPTNNEPEITEAFGAYLYAEGRARAMSGLFLYERRRSEIDPVTSKLIERHRTDIEYIDSAKHIELIFEFKKLKNKTDSRSKFYGVNGIQRFLHGTYRHVNDIAFMVGLVHLESTETVRALAIKIARRDIASVLHLIPDSKSQVVRRPSEYFPSIVEFDTKHSRPAHGGLSDITLCHFFLQHQAP